MVTYEEIARRAYELFINRGGAPGREIEDWLEAERQLGEPHGPDIQADSPADTQADAPVEAPRRKVAARRVRTATDALSKPRATRRTTGTTKTARAPKH